MSDAETIEKFNRLAAAMEYPMFIVTTADADGQRGGCLIGFATQCSIEPPRFLAGLSVKNHTYRVARGASHLAVHVIGKDDKELADLFGGETGDEVDKFVRCAWHTGPSAMPILDAVDAWFVGRIIERVELGDHVGHVLEPVAVQEARPANLQSGDVTDIEAGHPPRE
ncbi:MAG TPA: flavin reductase family protein [Acidimicrobiales bacterium]|nr:flavin reductase family protein [Acidimicrobiales bacterium]